MRLLGLAALLLCLTCLVLLLTSHFPWRIPKTRATPAEEPGGTDLLRNQGIDGETPDLYDPGIPVLPDGGNPDFGTILQAQIGYAESVIEGANVLMQMEKGAITVEIAAIDAYTRGHEQLDKGLTDLPGLRDRLQKIQTENWGEDTDKVRQHVAEIMEHLNKRDIFVRRRTKYEQYLEKLQKIQAEKGDGKDKSAVKHF